MHSALVWGHQKFFRSRFGDAFCSSHCWQLSFAVVSIACFRLVQFVPIFGERILKECHGAGSFETEFSVKKYVNRHRLRNREIFFWEIKILGQRFSEILVEFSMEIFNFQRGPPMKIKIFKFFRKNLFFAKCVKMI